MGKKEQTLRSLLCAVGPVTQGTLEQPTRDLLARSNRSVELNRVYRDLGGIRKDVPLNRLGPWDVEFEGVAVELDEQLHFNRYRLLTLESPAYNCLQCFPLEIYREYCRRYEDRSLRAGSHGGKWTNQSCEKQFGAPNAEGDLSGNGAPRWKQRAFYDFVKDLSWQLIGVRVVRIAIWDKVEDKIGERTIEEVLAKPAPDSGMVLAALIFQRFPR